MRRNNGTVIHGQTPGLLGERHASFVIDQSLLASDVKVEAVARNDDLTSLRLSARHDLLQQFDGERRRLDESAATQKSRRILSEGVQPAGFRRHAPGV